MSDEIVMRLKRKDEQAFNELIDLYGSSVYYLIKRIVGLIATHEDIEEMSSDVFVSVWNDIHTFDEQKGSLQTFIYMKAKYRALTFKRQNEGQQQKRDMKPIEVHHLPDHVELEKKLEEKWWIQKVIKWINELKEPDRSFFLLKYFHYYETKQIANHYETTVKAVESSLYRTRKRLLNLKLKEEEK